jgi:hypothetical protein
MFSTPRPRTPASNTGLYSHSACFSSRLDIGIDAVSLLWEGSSTDILSACALWLNLRFDMATNTPRKIGVFWDYCHRSIGGSLYSRRCIDGAWHYRLAISGSDCKVPPDMLLYFLQSAAHFVPGIRCSRLDIALDDYAKSLPPELFVSAINKKMHSGFRFGDYIQNLGRGGWTVYLGTRQSEQFHRYYNKSAESKGEIDSYRLEAEFKGQKSDFLFRCIIGCSTILDATSALQEMIFGNLIFYSHKVKNLSRCIVADWWQSFVDAVSVARIIPHIPVRPTSISRKIAWIEHQVSKSLAMIASAIGSEQFSEFVRTTVASGTDRMVNYDRLIIAEYDYWDG